MNTFEIPEDVQRLAAEIATLRRDATVLGAMDDGTIVSGWRLADVRRRNGSDHKEEWGDHDELCLSDSGILVLRKSWYQNQFKFKVENSGGTFVKVAGSGDVKALDYEIGHVDHSGDGRTVEAWGPGYGVNKRFPEYCGVKEALERMRPAP